MDAKDHPDTLAWYVNGTLSATARDEVERHLVNCARCREEVALLRLVRAQVKAEQVEPPTELGLKRLLRDVKAERAQAAGRRWKWIAAAAMVVITLQGGLWLTRGDAGSGMQLLGEPPRAGTALQVRFVPTATEAQMRALLQGIGATITDGPGAGGLYHVRVAGAPLSADEGRALVAQLRADPLVQHAARE